MEKVMINSFALSMFVLVGLIGFSQDGFIRDGLFRSQLTLSPSDQLNEQKVRFSVHGTLEGYISERLSLAGDTYYDLGGDSDDIFEFNHRFYFGPSMHKSSEGSDFFVGLQPGISIARISGYQPEEQEHEIWVRPMASITAGYNYFFHKHLHFFVHARASFGYHTLDMHQHLTTMSMSTGLGFNINALR
jgi:hypothetical protein